MSLHRWLQNLRSDLAQSQGRRKRDRRWRPGAATRRPKLEALESRCVLSFSPLAAFPLDDISALASGDFNNDNHLDLVTASANDRTVSVRLGDGLGGFGAKRDLTIEATSLVVGDLDGDGNDDLATLRAGDSNIYVRLGNGLVEFTPVRVPITHSDPQSLAVGDFDNDGMMDLVVGENYYYYFTGPPGSSYVEVLMGFEQNGFSVRNLHYLGEFGSPTSFTVADLDGDLQVDDLLAFAGKSHVLLADPWLRYKRALSMVSSPVAVGDFTGDGIPDLVTSGGNLRFLRGLGGGSFSSPVDFFDGGYSSLAAADFNADGNLDIVGTSGGVTRTFLGFGNGTFALSDEQPLGSSQPILVEDFNQDGLPDVAVVGNSVWLLLNDGDWLPLSPSIRIDDVMIVEGNTGTVAARFPVTLSASPTRTVTVRYNTNAGTATAGADYQEVTSGSLIFHPGGPLTQTITVLIYGDTIDEWDQTFYVNVSTVDVPVADGQALGTIVDNDAPPALVIRDAAMKEGNSGISWMPFVVTLSAPSEKPVQVSYITAAGSARPFGNDYLATSGTLYFGAGETSATIYVGIRGDTVKEKDERFFVNLHAASNASILDGQGVGTILNDDGLQTKSRSTSKSLARLGTIPNDDSWRRRK